MVTEETCIGPFNCRTQTGECCEVFLFEGAIVCPQSCIDDRQSDTVTLGGYSLTEIFKTSLVTTLMFSVLTNIGATTVSTTTTTTTTTAPTVTTSK